VVLWLCHSDRPKDEDSVENLKMHIVMWFRLVERYWSEIISLQLMMGVDGELERLLPRLYLYQVDEIYNISNITW
jgi:hypothetical protein